MRKRVRVALAVLLVILASVIAWQVFSVREPVYQGKPLSVWLDYYVSRQSEAQREMADRALDKVGTNAIPTLLWMLRQRDTSLKRRVMGLVQKQPFIKVHYIPAERRNQAAYFAFLKLGARAEVAVPALIEIYEQRLSPFSQQCAAESLGVIGPAAKKAIPVLVRGMADTNTLVRCDTLLALGKFRAEPEVVVPALTKSLNDPNPRVRLFACTALVQVGGEAKQAVPALVKALDDSDSSVRGQAAYALHQIDPEAAAAARAGVK
jgi:hypothetical protein